MVILRNAAILAGLITLVPQLTPAQQTDTPVAFINVSVIPMAT